MLYLFSQELDSFEICVSEIHGKEGVGVLPLHFLHESTATRVEGVQFQCLTHSSTVL